MSPNKRPVTVIGLGLMGTAIARAFLSAGHELTVWNRTPKTARPFVGLARVARSVREACAASSVIVVSLSDYKASDALLRRSEIDDVLNGKVLAQLTTGTPAGARDGEKWARAAGADYLDGAILAYPRDIGRDGTTILYSGSRKAFEENLDLLRVLGGSPVFCGEEVGRAAVLELAFCELLFATAGSLLHGMAMCAAESVPFDDFFNLVKGSLIPQWYKEFATNGTETGDYEAGNSTMTTHASALTQVVRASQDAAIDSSLPEALLNAFRRAIELGYGPYDMPSLYEAFNPLRKGASPSGP